MPSARVLAVGAALTLLGCGDSGGFAYEVTAFVLPDDIDVFSLSFDPALRATQRESYRQPYIGRTYRVDLGATELPRPTITIDVTAGGGKKSSATMVPYMCDAVPNFAERIAEGWSVVESAEVLVDSNGIVQTAGDFQRPMWHRCDLTNGGAGEGVSAANMPTPELCSEPLRRETNVLVSVDATGQNMAPTFCHANHLRADGGEVIQVRLVSDPTTPDSGDAFQVSLSHCLAANDVYPLQLAAPIPADCPFGPYEDIGLFVGPPNAVQHLRAISGGWRLDSVDLGLSGIVKGSVDATFIDSQNVTYHVAGAISLPNTMTLGGP